MIQVLAALGGGSTVLLAIAFITLTFLNRKDGRELLAARDIIEKAHEETSKVRGELALETTAHGVTRDELRKEKDLRASVESERNQAFTEGVHHVVEKLKKSGIADVQRFTADLLATPLPGFVPAEVPQGRATAPGPDSLIDPFAVQPASGPGADR